MACFSLFIFGMASVSMADEQTTTEARSDFDQAKQLYDAGKLDEAQAAFEKAIQANPSDTESRRYIRSIISIKRKMTHRDQNVMDSDRILEVRRAWVPIERTAKERQAASASSVAETTQSMQERVKQIIPEINFTDAQVADVLRYLSRISGINLVFDDGSKSGQAGATDVGTAIASHITISLKEVPLIEAIKYILAAKGLRYRLDEYAIVISSPSRMEGVEMETRYYHLSSGSAGFVAKPKGPGKNENDNSDKDTSDKSDSSDEGSQSASAETSAVTIKDVLEQSGVPFPTGSKIFLDKRTGILIVRNTPSNLAIIEKILNALDVAPFQIAIEAKFVDIEESTAREFGLEAFLNGDFAFTKQGPNNDVTMLANANNRTFGQFTGKNQGKGGLTKGLGFILEPGSSTNPAGNIFSIAQILTAPQFQVVLHALEQSGMANVLSAPKVTTVNNQQARIKVVTEIIYPTEYQITPATANPLGVIITPAVAIPGGFATRDTGVILEVTPSVGSDRKTISLVLKPEVSTLAGWTNFGVAAGPSNLGSNAIPVLQPIFTSQNVSTDVVVGDGETVVLGGLIRELTNTADTKIPVLGDIPGIGNLFRNQANVSTKRNLLIFVTSYLLTPEGETVREPRYKKTKIFNP